MKLKEIVNMKKLAGAFAVVALTAGIARSFWTYYAQLANGVVSQNTSYVLDMNETPNQAGIDRISAQAVFSSATAVSDSFTDGRASTGSITVNSVTGLGASTATATVTVAPIAQILAQAATNQFTVISTTSITGIKLKFNTNVLTNGVDWFTATTTSGTAASIVSALGKYSNIQASRINSVVYATATVAGSAGNAFSFTTSSPTAISTGSFNFVGGHVPALTNAYVTVNGSVLKQGYQWTVQDTSSGTATSLATAIGLVSGVDANAASSIVTASATVAGAAGNSYTIFSSSPGYLSLSGPTFSGGSDSGYITINGVTLANGTAWTAQSTASGTAKSISDAIEANSSLTNIINSTWTTTGVVRTTATVVGAAGNYAMTSSAPSALVLSGAAMTGGADSSYVINTPTITVVGHGLATGMSVLYTSATVTVAGLTNQTTYYAIKIDANNFSLASSAANATAGTFIVLASSNTFPYTTKHTFTLAAPSFSGAPSMAWYASNDGVNYNPLNVSSATYSSATNPNSYVWDFGPLNTRYLKLSVLGPTTGGLNLVVTVNGKNE